MADAARLAARSDGVGRRSLGLARTLIAVVALTASIWAQRITPQQSTRPPLPQTLIAVEPILPPRHPLPPEPKSAGETHFAFILYGDTRSGAQGDGEVVHPLHSALMDTMIATIKAREHTRYPVRFVMQTGDAVLCGCDARMWNVSYTPIIDRLTRGADIPYYLTAGNHDVTSLPAGDPARALGVHNTLAAIARLIPPEGSPRRLNGTTTYAFGYGPVFVIAFDSNVAADPLQLQWVREQLEGLDRRRFPIVVAFTHHPVYSSGPHGGPLLEPATLALRNLYMPLFRRHHVRLLATGHEHFFEQWVERYADGGRSYRIDEIVTGGGGAPTYTYRGEPDVTSYVAAGAAQGVRVEHLVRPGATIAENPKHFVVINVDGERLSEEVIASGNAPFAPFAGRSRIDLAD